jgi:hypothetical protein
MMRMHLVAAAVFAASASIAAVQTTQEQQPAPAAKPAKPSKVITLTGCVTADDTTPGQFTFADIKSGATYRLTGTDVKDYAGQRVQIAGLSPKKLVIRGGLVPSPNVAAQAGALDPSRSAISSGQAGQSGTGTTELPEFRVRAVKPVAGACPQK